MTRAIWRSSGAALLIRAGGALHLSDDYLRAYLGRPELAPPDEAGPGERAFHAALVEEPARALAPDELARVEDPDARENWAVYLRFRDHLLAHDSLEAAYLALFKGEAAGATPALFIDQTVHAIACDMLRGASDPFRWRAGELLFRTQRATLREGAVLLADEEIVDMLAATGGFGGLGALLAEAGTPPRSVEMDVMTAENANGYWDRAERFDMVADMTFGRPALDAFCRVMEAWVGRLAGLEARIQPVERIRDERWRWHIGLDAEASAILNALYEGEAIAEARLERLISLFRMELREGPVIEEMRNRPIYLGLARDAGGVVRVKPQNLIVNLPLARDLG